MVLLACKADWKWKFKSEIRAQMGQASPDIVTCSLNTSSAYIFEMAYVLTRWIGN